MLRGACMWVAPGSRGAVGRTEPLALGGGLWGWELAGCPWCAQSCCTTAAKRGEEQGSGCALLSSSLLLSPPQAMENIFSALGTAISHSFAVVRFGWAPPKPLRVVMCIVRMCLSTRYLLCFKPKHNPGITPTFSSLQGIHHPLCYHMAPWFPRGGRGPCHGLDQAIFPGDAHDLPYLNPSASRSDCFLAMAFTPSKQLGCSASAGKSS